MDVKALVKAFVDANAAYNADPSQENGETLAQARRELLKFWYGF
jgi:hypothetical protein